MKQADREREGQGEREAARLVVGFLRLLRRWSQRELGDACGMGRRTIGRYESGDLTPGREVLIRLAGAAGISSVRLDQLLAIFRRIAAVPEIDDERERVADQEELAAQIAADIAAEIEPEIFAALADLPFGGDPDETGDSN